MRSAYLSPLVVALVLGCARPSDPSQPVDPPLRYLCRVELGPLQTALRAAGGDPAQVLRVAAAADLLRLTSGARHKFVLRTTGQLVIAPLPESHPHNEYVHPILGDGAPVWTAGGITVTHAGSAVTSVVLDARSGSYCTTTESLRHAVRALRAVGVVDSAVSVMGRPLLCVEPAG